MRGKGCCLHDVSRRAPWEVMADRDRRTIAYLQLQYMIFRVDTI